MATVEVKPDALFKLVASWAAWIINQLLGLAWAAIALGLFAWAASEYGANIPFIPAANPATWIYAAGILYLIKR